MAEAELNWNLVTKVKAILDGELTKEGLDQDEIGIISKGIAEIGSLTTAIKVMKEEKDALEEHILGLKEDAHNMEMSHISMRKEVDQLASQAYAIAEARKALDRETEEIKWQLKELKTVKAGHALDMYTAWLMLTFLSDPGKISNADFDRLVELMGGIRLARSGQKPKQAVDAEGHCQYHIPLPYTPIEDYGIAMDEAKEQLAEYLVPLVKDKFMPRSEYEQAKLTQALTELYKQTASMLAGHPATPDQPADQPGPSEQKAILEETNTDEKPDEAVNADVAVPEQPAVPEVCLDGCSPDPVKARWEADKKFAARIGPRTCSTPYPWKTN